ncbi:MAG: hypothetical protein C6I01_00315 [Epsilonproteobacteria bacterium]|nr:hypothetical protein [Campylobacterota bacterium]
MNPPKLPFEIKSMHFQNLGNLELKFPIFLSFQLTLYPLEEVNWRPFDTLPWKLNSKGESI